MSDDIYDRSAWLEILDERDKKIDTLQAKVREYHEKYVHQDLLLAEQDKVRELEGQLEAYKKAKGPAMTPDERRARAEQVLGEIDTIPHPEEP